MDRIIDLTKAFTVKLSIVEDENQQAQEFVGKTSLNVGVGQEFSMVSKVEAENTLRIVKTKKIADMKQIEPHLIQIETENGYRYQIEIIDCPIKTII